MLKYLKKINHIYNFIVYIYITAKNTTFFKTIISKILFINFKAGRECLRKIKRNSAVGH